MYQRSKQEQASNIGKRKTIAKQELPNNTKEQVEILWLVNLSKDRYMLLYAYEAATCSKLTAVCILINQDRLFILRRVGTKYYYQCK
jgi:hypothetical protein